MPDMVLLEAEEKMEKAIENLKRDFAQIRTGRANPNILDHITIEYYGVKTPIRQIGSVTMPEASQLLIKPYDKSTLKLIEAAINISDLGIAPQNDGSTIRLVFPKLTEERRREMVKNLGKYSESCKVAIRNVRRDANDALKKLELPEDEEKSWQEDVQKLTDKFVEKVSAETKIKENELMSF